MKMGDVEDSEEGIAHGTSNYPIVRRHHRRGKRKPRTRRRTLSAELTPADESNQNSSKEDNIDRPAVTKEMVFDTNIKKENLLKPVGINAINLKSNEINQYNQVNKCAKKHRQKRRHRHYNKPYTSGVSKSYSGEKKNKLLILRPNRCPDAPRNSTQFIIDDHEDEEKNNARLPQEKQDSKPNSGCNVIDEPSSNDDFQPSPDDDTFWADYLERDFQTVYESAHREDVEKWDKSKLIEEIKRLEKRHKELVSKLSRVDPEIYIRRLQSRVISKQKHNSRLRARVVADMNVNNDIEERKESEVNEELKSTNEASQEEREIPSQSDAFQTDQYSDPVNPTNIVNLVPDSTNE